MAVNVSSPLSFTDACLQNRKTQLFFGSWYICKNIVVLPFSVYILHFGFQRWQSRSLQKSSNCDFFVYNLCVLEVLSCAGGVLYFCGYFLDMELMFKVGGLVFFVILPVETMTHALICADLYLAVVFPVLYMKSRQQSGVRVRNVCMVAVWAIGLSVDVIAYASYDANPAVSCLAFLAFNLAVVYFCEVSVLRVLLRRGPSNNGKVDKTKRKAFRKILSLSVITCVWFTGFVVCISLLNSDSLDMEGSCIAYTATYWFSFPCSFGIPMIFLQKHKKVLCCRGKPKLGSTTLQEGPEATTRV